MHFPLVFIGNIIFLEIVGKIQKGWSKSKEENLALLSSPLTHAFLSTSSRRSYLTLGCSVFQYFIVNTLREFSQWVENGAAYIFRKPQQCHWQLCKINRTSQNDFAVDISAKISLLEYLQNDFLKETHFQLKKKSSVHRSMENNKGEPTYLPPVWIFRHEDSHGSPLSILPRDPSFPRSRHY